ncbi:D-alanine--D-alanine ligase [Bienertia sinuspersici]
MERGISLNSARSLLDHIQGDDIEVSCYYIDCELNAYAISSAQILVEHLAASVILVFPVIHGPFGEDELLERAAYHLLVQNQVECRKAFDKYEASLELSRKGFLTAPSFLIQVKPTRGGSSIGVSVAYGAVDSYRKASQIISEGVDDKSLVEIFLEGGREFTAIVLDVGIGSECNPVVLLPTEVELHFQDTADLIEKDAIFNYRRKYLPTQQVAYHTPPRFPLNVIKMIREGASLLFQHLGLCDFARIDGWYLPSSPKLSTGQEFGRSDSGLVLFTDINLVGFSHSRILRSILQRACSRFPDILPYTVESPFLLETQKHFQTEEAIAERNNVHKVFVIFGGDTSERQVSLMSGTNVWLNLQVFTDLDVTPFLLAPTNSSSNEKDDNLSSRSVWSLPYSLVLRHTCEEVLTACVEAMDPDRAALTSQLKEEVMNDLLKGLNKHTGLVGFDISDEIPVKYSLFGWVKLAKEVQATVFIAVHGGIGEDVPAVFVGGGAGSIHWPWCDSLQNMHGKAATSVALKHLAEYGVLT